MLRKYFPITLAVAMVALLVFSKVTFAERTYQIPVQITYTETMKQDTIPELIQMVIDGGWEVEAPYGEVTKPGTRRLMDSWMIDVLTCNGMQRSDMPDGAITVWYVNDLYDEDGVRLWGSQTTFEYDDAPGDENNLILLNTSFHNEQQGWMVLVALEDTFKHEFLHWIVPTITHDDYRFTVCTPHVPDYDEDPTLP